MHLPKQLIHWYLNKIAFPVKNENREAELKLSKMEKLWNDLIADEEREFEELNSKMKSFRDNFEHSREETRLKMGIESTRLSEMEKKMIHELTSSTSVYLAETASLSTEDGAFNRRAA